MLLAIDCGNTNTVFAIWDGARFLGTWRIATDWRRTADEYFVWLTTIMRLQAVEARVEEVIISSTVPRVVFNLRYYDEMPYEQMSRVLETSEGALKASYHHAVKKIEDYILNH